MDRNYPPEWQHEVRNLRTAEMTSNLKSRFDATQQLQTLRPKIRLRVAAFFVFVIIFLAFISYWKRGVQGAFYGGLSALAAVCLIVQYRKEGALARNSLVGHGCCDGI